MDRRAASFSNDPPENQNKKLNNREEHEWPAIISEECARMSGGGCRYFARCPPSIGPSQAQTKYPERPVRIIVPYGAGGVADVTTRLVAQKVSEAMGQTFVIENRPGAGGIVGAKGGAGVSAGRLHALSRRERQRDQRVPVQVAAFQRRPRLHAGLASGGVRDVAGDQGGSAAGYGREGRRLRQGQSRKAELRHDRHRQHAAPVGRAVQDGHQACRPRS